MEKAGVNYIVPDGLDPFFEREFSDWEPDTFDVFAAQPRGHVAWDIGAWIGVTARWLSERFDFVLAFEPDDMAAGKARSLLDSNGCTNVDLRRIAVIGSGSPSHLRLASRGEWGNSQSFLSPDGARDVETLPVAEIFPRPDFIKCDIEGGEQWILDELLSMKVPCLVSFHIGWWSRSISDCADILSPFNDRATAGGLQIHDVPEYVAANPFCSVFFP